MSHSITIKLNKPANEFAAGESIGFNIRGGVQYYDRKTKQKEWTNYSAVIFAKAERQIDYYRQVLIENAVVELGCKQLKIDVYDGQNGQVLSLEMIDAWVGSVNQSAPRQEQATQQPQVTQVSNSNDYFDDNLIPF